MAPHRQEEVYWRQRGTINWTLKGDSPTSYFFAIANGRRRHSLVDNLLINGVRVSDQSEIMRHVVNFSPLSSPLNLRWGLGWLVLF